MLNYRRNSQACLPEEWLSMPTGGIAKLAYRRNGQACLPEVWSSLPTGGMVKLDGTTLFLYGAWLYSGFYISSLANLPISWNKCILHRDTICLKSKICMKTQTWQRILECGESWSNLQFWFTAMLILNQFLLFKSLNSRVSTTLFLYGARLFISIADLSGYIYTPEVRNKSENFVSIFNVLV